MKPLLNSVRLSGWAAAAAVATGFFGLAADSRAGDASVISWNIEWYPGKTRTPAPEDSAAHAERVKPVLARLNPDIFLAQEMRDWQSFAELCDAVPGLRPAVVSAFRSEDTGEYWPQQLGIASKFPVVAGWSEPWGQGEEIHPRRGFAAAAIEVPGHDGVVLVYNVHLKSNRSNSVEEEQLNYRTRDESIRQLLAHIEEMETVVFKDRVAAVIIGGDFNTNHDGQFGDHVIEMLKDAGFYHTWGDTARADRLSWRGSARFEPTTFDHFFTKGLGSPAAKLLEVPDETSDHWPIQIAIPAGR